MTDNFGDALSDRLETVTLTDVARKMAGAKGNPRNILSTLSRIRQGKQTPSQRKVMEIAGALGSLRKLSDAEREQLRSELLRAAGYDDPRISDLKTATKLELSESEKRGRLRPACRQALQTVDALKEYEIESILDHISVSTMKLIIAAAERGEEIEVVQLQQISAELRQTAAKHLATASHPAKDQAKKDTVIDAGRARILVDGKVSETQMQILRNAAQMIRSVLEL